MTQAEYDNAHGYTMMLIEQYYNGILTLMEFKNALDRFTLGDVKGLLDTATGLRYP
jgi:hypothetical protein